MTDINLTGSFEVKCRECSTPLEASWDIRYGLPDQETLIVDSCATCIIIAVDEALKEEQS